MKWLADIFIGIALAVCSSSPLVAAETIKSCPSSDIPVTKPSKVDLDRVFSTMTTVKTSAGELAYTVDDTLKEQLQEMFGNNRTTSKMEQFFGTLFIIQNHSPLQWGVTHTLEIEPIRRLLQETGVVPESSFTQMLKKIRFRQSSLTPYYEVQFTEPEVLLPFNKGAGFRAWQHGMCQHAQAIVFTNPASFYVKVLKNGNFRAYKFKNVMIKGEFGTRGIFDITLNYVDLMSITFIRNSAMGYVQARVAEKEFEVNDHSWILRVITRFFSDTTKQAIDW